MLHFSASGYCDMGKRVLSVHHNVGRRASPPARIMACSALCRPGSAALFAVVAATATTLRIGVLVGPLGQAVACGRAVPVLGALAWA
jgi:hypothetical protein